MLLHRGVIDQIPMEKFKLGPNEIGHIGPILQDAGGFLGLRKLPIPPHGTKRILILDSIGYLKSIIMENSLQCVRSKQEL